MKLPDLRVHNCISVQFRVSYKIDRSIKAELDEVLVLDNPTGDPNFKGILFEENNQLFFLRVKYYPRRTSVHVSFSIEQVVEGKGSKELRVPEYKDCLVKFWALMRKHVTGVRDSSGIAGFIIESQRDKQTMRLPSNIPNMTNAYVTGTQFLVKQD